MWRRALSAHLTTPTGDGEKLDQSRLRCRRGAGHRSVGSSASSAFVKIKGFFLSFFNLILSPPLPKNKSQELKSTILSVTDLDYFEMRTSKSSSCAAAQ